MGLCRPSWGTHPPGVGARGSLEQKPQPLLDNQGTPRRIPPQRGHSPAPWGCLGMWGAWECQARPTLSLLYGCNGLRGKNVPGRKAADSKGTE